MKILLVAENLNLKSGGPTKVVCELAEILAQKGISVAIFSPVKRKAGEQIYHSKRVDVRLFSQGCASKWWTGYSADLAKALNDEASDFDLVHIHEIWHYPHYAAAMAAEKAGKPYIVTVHGSLDPWCLGRKYFKKRIFSLFCERRILRGAAAIQSLTKKETEDIKNFGVSAPIVKIPNGIDIKEFQELPAHEDFEREHVGLRDKQVILFLSRIHVKKGLDILAKAFGHIARKRDDVRLVIGGPDNDNYQRQVEDMLKKENVLQKTVFTGMLTGVQKLSALARADIFVLPSYSEGFSMAVLEAMACGLPVIVTDQCNFPEIIPADAGIVIRSDARQLAKALESLLNDSCLRDRIGKNAKKLISEKFTLEAIANQMIMLYEKTIKKS